jgi:hypothetical protein
MNSSKLQKPSLKELTLNKSRIEQKCPKQKFELKNLKQQFLMIVYINDLFIIGSNKINISLMKEKLEK